MVAYTKPQHRNIYDVTITAKCGILDHIEPWISSWLIRILQFKTFCMKNRQQLEYQHFLETDPG